MDVSTLYSLRSFPRPALDAAIHDIISKLKISFKPTFRRPIAKRSTVEESSNWREVALVSLHRRVREKDDPDYDEINAFINKLTKQTYEKMITAILGKLETRDGLFRLRVTTLLFDRGCTQTFFASLMADAYRDIAKVHPDALEDLKVQVSMFDALYADTNVTVVPNSTDAGYNEAIIAWTKQKERKRTFAVYIAELYSRGLVPKDTMTSFVTTVVEDLKDVMRHPKTPPGEEHVDSLVRFLFAVAGKVNVKDHIKGILLVPRADTPCLNMKSRFKLEDSLKL